MYVISIKNTAKNADHHLRLQQTLIFLPVEGLALMLTGLLTDQGGGYQGLGWLWQFLKLDNSQVCHVDELFLSRFLCRIWCCVIILLTVAVLSKLESVLSYFDAALST